MAINTGLRAGEIWGLKPEDIQKDSDVILIRRQLDRLLGEFRPTKGKENRRIPCNAELRRELIQLIANRSEKAETLFSEDLESQSATTTFEIEGGRMILNSGAERKPIP